MLDSGAQDRRFGHRPWLVTAGLLVVAAAAVRALSSGLSLADTLGPWLAVVLELAAFGVAALVILFAAHRAQRSPIAELAARIGNRRPDIAGFEIPYLDREDETGALARAVAQVLAETADVRQSRDQAVADEMEKLVGHLQAVLDTLPVGVVIYDWEDQIELCNKAMIEKLYPDLADVLQTGTPFDRLLRVSAQRGRAGPIDKPLETWLYEQLKEHKTPGGARVVERQPGAWTEVREIRLKEGFAVGIYRDVTEMMEKDRTIRRQNERARRHQEQLGTVLKSMDNGVLLFSEDQRVEFVNAAYLGLFFTPTEFIARKAPIQEIAAFHGVGEDEDWAGLEWRSYVKAVSDAIDRRIETVRDVERPDGTVISYQCRRFKRGGGVLLFRNATPETPLADELPALVDRLQINQELAQSTVAKRQELIQALHELLTPGLEVVSDLAESAAKGVEKGQARTDLANLTVNVARIRTALQNAALLVSIEDGTLELAPQKYRLGDLVEDVIDRFAERAEDKGIDLTLSYSAKGDPNTLVTLDADWTAYVLDAVIDNAVKFTASGSVDVSVTCVRQREKNMLRVVVTDTGRGMGLEQLGTVFEPLLSETGEDVGRRSARTLSMPLCRAVCRLMGGNIVGNSELGAGTAMTIEIPVPGFG